MGKIDLDDPPRQRMTFDEAVQPLAGRRPELYASLLLNRYIWNTDKMHELFGDGVAAENQFQVGVWNYTSSCKTLDQRLGQIDQWLTPTDTDSCKLIVLPEFSFTGVPASANDARAMGESIAGATVTRLVTWCQKSGHYLVAGLIEAEGEELYNTLILVGPQGLCAHYRKTHLGSADLAWATPGAAFAWTDTPFGRIGLLSGTDLLYPEPLRCLALEGVDLVCVPAALAGPEPRVLPDDDSGTKHWHLFRTRAAENNVYVAVANWHGMMHGIAYMGHSGIFFGPVLFDAPAIESVATHDGEDRVAVMTVDTRSAKGNPNPVRAKPALRRRLSAYYAPLVNRAKKKDQTHSE